MYPPLTGYKEKENPEHKMSIDSIGPSQASQFVKPAERAEKPHQQVEKVSNEDVKKQQDTDKEAGKMNCMNASSWLLLITLKKLLPILWPIQAIFIMKVV